MLKESLEQLKALHSLGIVHGDISRIFLQEMNVVELLIYTLARIRFLIWLVVNHLVMI